MAEKETVTVDKQVIIEMLKAIAGLQRKLQALLIK